MERAKLATNDEAIIRYQKALCVHGYHVCKEIWEAVIGEFLVCMTEPGNSHHWNAMAVEMDENVIGHLPRKVLWLCVLFLKRDGNSHCTVTAIAVQFFCLANCLMCLLNIMALVFVICITTKFKPPRKFPRLQYVIAKEGLKQVEVCGLGTRCRLLLCLVKLWL